MYIYIFQKTAYVHIYLEERKNRQLFVDQFSTYTYHLVHEFDLRSPISCKKIFYIRAILIIFRRFYKIMETRSVLIVCTYVRTYCTCINCMYSVHIYNFRESAYIAYIYNFFLHMGQRSSTVDETAGVSWSSRALSKICIFFIFCMRYVHRTRIKSEFRRGDPIPDVRWESICPTLQLVNAFTHSWVIVRRRRRRHRI